MEYKNLCSELTIRGKVYRNRMLAAPTGFAQFLVFPPMQKGAEGMLVERAKGGQASVCVGEQAVSYVHGMAEGDGAVQMRPLVLEKIGGEDFQVLKDIAEKIKAEGALAFMELSHPGETGTPSEKYPVIFGPMEKIREDGVKVKAMDILDMEEVCRQFADCAVFSKKAGYDGVLIHGGHGFLFTQFFSPLTNQRTDEYGGSLENRFRFPLMVLQAVRDAVGENFLIELRISGSERIEGGVTADMMAEFGSRLSGLVDILHVSSGHYFRSARTLEFSSAYSPHGCNLDLAKVIKAKLPSDVYLGCVGGFNNPDQAEEAIAAGEIDFVIFGRQMFADPEFANKVMEGKADSIHRCIRCMRCYPGSPEHPDEIAYIKKHGIHKEKPNPRSCYCSVNPKSTGFFAPSFHVEPAEEKKKVLVVGGGIAGLTAALAYKERGHEVTLAESSGQLGGILWFLDRDPVKEDLKNFRDLLIRQVQESGIRILLNTKVTAENVSSFEVDEVMIAVGAHPLVPNIEGIETAVEALEAYRDTLSIGKHVVIVGGGLVGCDTAVMLAEQGRDVLVVEMQERLAPEAAFMQFTTLMDRMDELGVKHIVNAKCTKIENGGVHVEIDGADQFITADTVIYSLGMTPNKEIADALSAALPESVSVKLSGDCLKVGRVGDAGRSAYLAAGEIKPSAPGF